MNNKLIVYEESGTMPEYLISYDPAVSTGRSYSMATPDFTLGVEIIDRKTIPILQNPKYRKLSKRRIK